MQETQTALVVHRHVWEAVVISVRHRGFYKCDNVVVLSGGEGNATSDVPEAYEYGFDRV